MIVPTSLFGDYVVGMLSVGLQTEAHIFYCELKKPFITNHGTMKVGEARWKVGTPCFYKEQSMKLLPCSTRLRFLTYSPS